MDEYTAGNHACQAVPAKICFPDEICKICLTFSGKHIHLTVLYSYFSKESITVSEHTSGAREMLASRLGFILLAAGCAIGLGNIWRFPYITGQYGGAFFVLMYLFFLVVLGFPVMVMELSIGRAGRLDIVGCYKKLKSPERPLPWEKPGMLFFSGNMILLMFYTAITGWLLAYTWYFLTGTFSAIRPADVPEFFNSFLASPGKQILFTYIAIAITVAVCIAGLKSGVERVTKFMMAGLFILMIGLAVQACRLPNGMEGVKFFLKPNFGPLAHGGLWPAVHAAMTQAFFTLSLGIGSIAICGSYISREQSLPQEAAIIIGLDTFVAICSGLIIFPSCFAYGVSPDQGPSLIFVTLPRIFLDMEFGMVRGTVFFLFLSIAAVTTLIAVAENVIAFGIDELRFSRRKSTLITSVLLFVLSLPCIFGFNLWKSFQPLGRGSSILDLEDFIVSDNFLPLGAFLITLFCSRRRGWGYRNFLAEANAGSGFNFPKMLEFYITWILPAVILLIWIIGLVKRFHWLDI